MRRYAFAAIAVLTAVIPLISACGQDRSTSVAQTPAAPTPPHPDLECSYQVTPGEIVIPRDAWTGEVSIATSAGCPWTATTTVPWLRVRSGSGTGAATLAYETDFNPETRYAERRLGTIEIRRPASSMAQTVRITQWGDCNLVASPAKDGLPPGAVYSGSAPKFDSGTLTMSAAGGRVHFWVLTDPFMGCAWTAESDDSWVVWNSPRMHQIMGGDGDLVFTVPAKFSGGTRSAVVTLGGRYRLTIVQ